MILEHFIPLLGSYLGSGIAQYIFVPILCCAIVATIPCMIRALVRSR